MISPLYHGTTYADRICRDGFLLSLSGFGQKSLMGVAFAVDESEGTRYASTGPKADYMRHLFNVQEPEGQAEILVCQAKVNHHLDIRGLKDGACGIWKILGKDVMGNEDDRKYVQQANGRDPFSLTEELKNRGYDAVLLNSTLGTDNDEWCIFDPAAVKVLERRPVTVSSPS